AVTMQHIENTNILQDRRAATLRAFCQGQRKLLWDYLSVVRQPACAQHVVNAQERPLLARSLRTDDLDLDAEPLGHRRGPMQLGHPLFRPSDDQAPDL